MMEERDVQQLKACPSMLVTHGCIVILEREVQRKHIFHQSCHI